MKNLLFLNKKVLEFYKNYLEKRTLLTPPNTDTHPVMYEMISVLFYAPYVKSKKKLRLDSNTGITISSGINISRNIKSFL